MSMYLGGTASKIHEFINWTPLHQDVDLGVDSGIKCEGLWFHREKRCRYNESSEEKPLRELIALNRQICDFCKTQIDTTQIDTNRHKIKIESLTDTT